MQDGLDPLYIFIALLMLIIIAIIATIDFKDVFKEIEDDSTEG